jgi:HSP20 family protein
MSEEHEYDLEKEEVETPEGVETTRPGRIYVPRVDIIELNDRIELMADLPGVSEDSLDITLEKGQLTLQGYVNFERPQGYDLAHVEYGIGNFRRVFRLSDEVDQANITATFKQGVLRLNMPFSGGQKMRKIAVQTA